MIYPKLNGGIQIMRHHWGEDLDDFLVYLEVFIGPDEDSNDSDIFYFKVISPKRLQKILGEEGLKVGRGFLIMNDFNIQTVEKAIHHILKKCAGKTWKEVCSLISRYAYWVGENSWETAILWEIPDFTDVIDRLQKVLKGELTREQVAKWASKYVCQDHPKIEDPETWDLLIYASGIDLRSSPDEDYLHDNAGIRQVIEKYGRI